MDFANLSWTLQFHRGFYIGVRGCPERDISSLGVMGWGLEAAGNSSVVALLRDHSISDHLVSDRLLSDRLVSDHLLSDHLLSDHLLSGHLLSDHLQSDHLLSDHLLRAPQ